MHAMWRCDTPLEEYKHERVGTLMWRLTVRQEAAASDCGRGGHGPGPGHGHPGCGGLEGGGHAGGDGGNQAAAVAVAVAVGRAAGQTSVPAYQGSVCPSVPLPWCPRGHRMRAAMNKHLLLSTTGVVE